MKKLLILFSVLFMLISCQQPNVSSPNESSPSVNTEEQQLNQLLASGVISTFCNNTIIQHYTVTCTIQIFVSEEAKDVLVGCRIITHKGNEKEVSAMAIREVRSDEKVYKLKIASVSAVESKFSEDHPIMVVKNPSARRASKNLVKIKIYEQANKIISIAKTISFSSINVVMGARIS